MRRIITLAALGAALLAGPSHPAAAESFQWVQYGAAGAEARAVTDRGACPALALDGVAIAMTVRSSPNAEFPVTSCAAALPAGVAEITMDGRPMSPPPRALNRIVVIGDTGCRMKNEAMQACNDPVAWPFRQIADQAAYLKPDLIIHVGDYHYRETPCPTGNRGCAGSPVGDNWAVWRADFFSPAEALLPAAPWVFVRGNHEICDRGGHGWTRTIEPYPFDPAEPCAAARQPYLARLPGLTLAVLDSSSAGESKIDEAQLPGFRRQFAALAETLTDPSWLVLHRPIWGIAHAKNGVTDGANLTLGAAAAGTMPAAIAMMLSGHIHTFQLINYQGGQPPQIVAGHGGDNLDRDIPADLSGLAINGAHIARGVNYPAAFGFLTLDRADKGWTVTDYDTHGVAVRKCALEGRTISCPS
jgi:hypothetical protein